jgi:hypothetical protein
MQKFNLWIKKVLSENNGSPSSVRVCLLLLVAAVVGCVVYVIVQHTIHHVDGSIIDIPKNLADLLAFTVGALAAAKTGSKFGEEGAPRTLPTAPPVEESHHPTAKATDPNI